MNNSNANCCLTRSSYDSISTFGALIILFEPLRNSNPSKIMRWYAFNNKDARKRNYDFDRPWPRRNRFFVRESQRCASNAPVKFEWWRFSAKWTFAFTINKSQEQTLEITGVVLDTHYSFSHGLLYAACSRAGGPDNLFVCAPYGKTANAVHSRAFALWDENKIRIQCHQNCLSFVNFLTKNENEFRR